MASRSPGASCPHNASKRRPAIASARGTLDQWSIRRLHWRCSRKQESQHEDRRRLPTDRNSTVTRRPYVTSARPPKRSATTTCSPTITSSARPTIANPKLWGPYTEQDPFHDPFVMFAYLAGQTERLEFATGVIILPPAPNGPGRQAGSRSGSVGRESACASASALAGTTLNTTLSARNSPRAALVLMSKSN